MATTTPGKGEKVQIQDTATTGSGDVVVPAPSIENHTVYLVTSDDTTSAGKVKVESADNPDYAGTWVLEGTEQTLVRNTALAVSFVGARGAIRARVSTDITGGATLNAYYLGR